MPTHEEESRFWQDWDRLSSEQRLQFRAALNEMVEDLKANQPFRSSLRIRRFHRIDGAYEMSWAKDGRALFRFGVSPHASEPHIIWLRIGKHEIYK